MELTSDQLWVELGQVAHPFDAPLPDAWKPYYWALYQTARRLAPSRIIEIGVRAGYSAYTMLRACPRARFLGIDGDLDERWENTHGGRRGLVRHALRILAATPAQILIADSHQIQALPECDLVYVDGDHSRDGCLEDLRLATAAAPRVLVDDFCSIESVRDACRAFLAEQGPWQAEFIENSLTGFLLLERKVDGHAIDPSRRGTLAPGNHPERQ